MILFQQQITKTGKKFDFCALFSTRFRSIPAETLQKQHLLTDDPHLPRGSQRVYWHDHLQAKVHGADLWPVTIQGHFPHRYGAIAGPHSFSRSQSGRGN